MSAFPCPHQAWLTPSQAARRLGVSVLRVQQLIAAGRLRYIRTPLGRLVDPGGVAQELERRAAQRGGGADAA